MKTGLRIITGLAAALFLWCAAHAAPEYAEIAVHETAGLHRALWPVQVGVTVPAAASADSLVLARVEEDGSLQAVAFQLVGEIVPRGVAERRPGSPWANLRDIKTLDIAFVTELAADASLEFRLYYGAPEADVAPAAELPGLEVTRGEGLARTVNTGAARFEFHARSGQMTKYGLAGNDYTPEFYRNEQNEPIHGSGDTTTSANNVRNWNLEDEAHGLTYQETTGPITWQSVRSGYIPNTGGQLAITVTYKAFAGVPFVITSTQVYFHSDYAVRQLRSGQLVFSRGFHTHGVYLEPGGGFEVRRAYDPDDHAKHFGDLGVEWLSPDIPFIGMLHEDRGYGIGFVTLDRANYRTRQTAFPQDGGARYRFMDSSLHGAGNPRNFFYLVRYETYHGNNRLVIPAGSRFNSRSAILAYPVGDKAEDGRYEVAENWVTMLRNPVMFYAR